MRRPRSPPPRRAACRRWSATEPRSPPSSAPPPIATRRTDTMSTHAEVFPPLDEPEAPPAAARPRRRPPRAALVAGVLLAAGAAYYFWPTHGSAPSSYVTAPVDRGKIEQSVNSTGAVNPVTTVQVGTYVSGPIQAIDVTFNSRVTKGQRIAKIDPAPFAVKVREAE